MYRILLVDDHVAFRQALATVIDKDPGLTVVAQAGSLEEARTVLGGIDVAVVDLDLQDSHGTALIKDLHAVCPQAMVLVLTASLDPTEYGRAVEVGAAGVLHKSTSLDEIVDGLYRLGAGDWLLSPSDAVHWRRAVTQQREHDRQAQEALAQLTPREREVLEMLAEGLSSKEIAERLYMTPETERTHMVNVLSKLGVHSRLQALVFALRHGAVTVG